MTDDRRYDDLVAQVGALARSWTQLSGQIADIAVELELVRRALTGVIARVDRLDDDLETGIRDLTDVDGDVL